MRLIHTFSSDQDAQTLSAFLSQKEIENQVDLIKNSDWGTHEYGDIVCQLWVIDEDDAEAANKWLALYLENPDDSMFTPLRPSGSLMLKSLQEKIQPQKKIPPAPKPKPKPSGIVTIYLIIGCTLLLFWSTMTSYSPETHPQHLATSLFSSPIKKELIYDYPQTYQLLDKFITTYGFKSLTETDTLPPEGRHLLQQLNKTPFWQGLYGKTVHYLKKPAESQSFQAPMFESIKKGEVWRIFTPAFLHSGAFHLLFNMLWLLVLGKQIEDRIGVLRYLIFILLTAAFSNTAQYMMSGPNFSGFSGVLCAMITFVWFRQKIAPWEGYQLLPTTMTFITVLIAAMAGMQIVSFFLEIAGQETISTGIANTAHLSGGLAGYLIAQLNFFSWQNGKS